MPAGSASGFSFESSTPKPFSPCCRVQCCRTCAGPEWRMFDNIELGNMEKKALAWMTQMRILRLIPPAFAVLTLSAAEISPQAYLDHVRYLASPELKGRATGSPELEKAAN